ncbi:helix-turn-helix domain-containing protein [Porphyromonas levii]|uniref:helix-turn-helix domain-containing protein n=1 Tax=Porphyromonas levii TaxID=28114 RepID=UPI001B8AF4BC|nr:AraC family transcriptional regulator [Porphyromonas levii]MBR8703537.1 hypothetical protein [Porphyromonas levii]MBR8712763.1 hypothetical protein [Porphyromonas levii]MBR8714812.1 hypothetical protein [Porphyromonas levii]MBR8727328.1 hypothetical protein [Porphyromonas levii]MBR8735631.1 hypothetical protein [Porphyromonas levii]
MKPINIERHYTCSCYAGGDEGAYFEVQMNAQESSEITSGSQILLVFVNCNDTRYTISSSEEGSPNNVNETRNAPFGMLIDSNHTLRVMLGERGVLQIFKFDRISHLCNGYSFSNLRRYAPLTMAHRTIEVYEPLKLALATIYRYYNDGLKCSDMMEAKLKEVFFVLSGYYKPEVLGELLAPLLRKEVDFKEFVMMNHYRAKSVQELAELRGMDLRKFNKLFKETFNVPPYTWMLEQKADLIEERLSDPTVPFKDIMDEFRFSSPSHFTVFCRRQFNRTPSQHRKELVKEEAERRAAERRANNPHYYNQTGKGM